MLCRWLDRWSGSLGLASEHGSESRVLGVAKLGLVLLSRGSKTRGMARARHLGKEACKVSVETRCRLCVLWNIVLMGHGTKQLRESARIKRRDDVGDIGLGRRCSWERICRRLGILREGRVISIGRCRRLGCLGCLLCVINEHSGRDQIQIGIFCDGQQRTKDQQLTTYH